MEVVARLMMILVGFIIVMLGFITFIHSGEHRMLGLLICFAFLKLSSSLLLLSVLGNCKKNLKVNKAITDNPIYKSKYIANTTPKKIITKLSAK